VGSRAHNVDDAVDSSADINLINFLAPNNCELPISNGAHPEFTMPKTASERWADDFMQPAVVSTICGATILVLNTVVTKQLNPWRK
jgi:hypothetical protein